MSSRLPARAIKPKPVAAVDRALSILDAFRLGDQPLSLAEVARRTKLSKATILRLAGTLEQRQFLSRTSDGHFVLGAKPLQLGGIFQSMIQPIDVIPPLLRALSVKTGESASFMIRQGDLRVCLYRIDSPQTVRDHLKPGSILPMNKGAAGRVIMAFSPPYPKPYRAIRESIVDMSISEITPDVASICAPIFDGQGIAGAIALSGPKTRFTPTALRAMKKEILVTAQAMSSALSGDAKRFDQEIKTARATDIMSSKIK